MKFLLTKTSNDRFKKKIVIKNLKELLVFLNKHGELILQRSWWLPEKERRSTPFTIEIYDWYRE